MARAKLQNYRHTTTSRESHSCSLLPEYRLLAQARSMLLISGKIQLRQLKDDDNDDTPTVSSQALNSDNDGNDDMTIKFNLNLERRDKSE
jgi:hypothetical protein